MKQCYVLLDILDAYCNKLSLKLMRDDVTNIDLLNGYDDLLSFLKQYVESDFKGPHEKKFDLYLKSRSNFCGLPLSEMSEGSMRVPLASFRFPLIERRFQISNVLSIAMLDLDKKSIVSTLLSDLTNSQDIQVLLPYWKAESFLFQPYNWSPLWLTEPVKFKVQLKSSIEVFWKVRNPSLKLHYPNLTEKDLGIRIAKLV